MGGFAALLAAAPTGAGAAVADDGADHSATATYHYDFQYPSDSPTLAEIDAALGSFELPLSAHSDFVNDTLARWTQLDFHPDLANLRLLDFDPHPVRADLVLIPRDTPITYVASNATAPEDAALSAGAALTMAIPVTEVGTRVPTSIGDPLAPMATRYDPTKWPRTNVSCASRDQNGTGYMDMCSHVHIRADDGSSTRDYVAWRQFASFKARTWTGLQSAAIKHYPMSNTIWPRGWVEWDPMQGRSGSCQQIPINVSWNGASVGSSPVMCEEWGVNKANAPGGYRLTWKDWNGKTSTRALDYWTEVWRGATESNTMTQSTCFSTWASQCA